MDDAIAVLSVPWRIALLGFALIVLAAFAWRRRSEPFRIPLYGGPLAENRHSAFRTRGVRWMAIGAFAGAFAGAWLTIPRSMPEEQHEVVSRGTSGMIVLDLSSSVVSINNAFIADAIERLVKKSGPDKRFGLVPFSDDAYVALPPSAHPKAWNPILAIYRASSEKPKIDLWTDASFRGNTNIARGLLVALRTLERDGNTDAAIVLISDLNDSYVDRPVLEVVLAEFVRRGVDLRIIPVAAREQDAAFFRQALGEWADEAFVASGDTFRDATPEATPIRPRQPKPAIRFVIAVALTLVGAALWEMVGSAPLSVTARPARLHERE